MLVSGAGVGLVIPRSRAPAHHHCRRSGFATGAAVLTMGRQIGAALGVSVLVAVLGANAAASNRLSLGVGDQPRWGTDTALVFAALGPRLRRVSPAQPAQVLAKSAT